jgi:hypothetical protein
MEQLGALGECIAIVWATVTLCVSGESETPFPMGGG